MTDGVPMLDGPSAIDTDGNQYWYRDDKRHRDDGPAIIGADGSQHWYRDGKLHRDDGPAIIEVDGTKLWYRDGKLNRDDGPAIIGADGSQFWYRDGKLNRDDGPAIIEANGSQYWYREGNEIFTAELEFVPNQPVILVFGPASGYEIFGGVRDGLKVVFPSEGFRVRTMPYCGVLASSNVDKTRDFAHPRYQEGRA